MNRRAMIAGAGALFAAPKLGLAAGPGGLGAAAARRGRLAAVKSWAVQYRGIDPFEIAASPYDLIVTDYRPDLMFGTEWPFARSDVEVMQRKADGRRRLAIAYLSVGEAEDYRWYWPRAWTIDPASRPAWIGTENPRWPGNFPVRFWHSDWQSILFRQASSYLDRINEAGFDGIYLDRVDVYQEFQSERPGAAEDMVAMVEEIAAYAHRRNPRFLVVLQNAEELTVRARVRAAIDGFAKEDLFYGVDHDGSRNSAEAVAAALKPLRALRQSGIKVLLLEYPRDASAAADIRAKASAEGFTLLLADRELAGLAPLYPATARTD